MQNKLVYIGFAFQHHMGGHAGYHQIGRYLSYDYNINAQRFSNKCEFHSSSRIIRVLRREVCPRLFKGFRSVPWHIFRCMWMALTKGHMTFHFIYGENLYKDYPLLHVRGSKVVVTLHQPVEWFKLRNEWLNYLQKVDHVILLCQKDVDDFKIMTGRNNVTFIPHGICTDFYCPDSSVAKDRMVLTVGNWLRDYSFADRVYQRLLELDREVRIVVVSLPNNKALITPNERITFLSGISDEDLRDLYRKTSCLFLPLIRYTANNALLEAGAVGCPILISSDAPDNSYLPDGSVILTRMNESESVGEIERCLNGQCTNEELSIYVADRYSWPGIADSTKKILLEA